jgi:hypothetical protein
VLANRKQLPMQGLQGLEGAHVSSHGEQASSDAQRIFRQGAFA